MVELLLDRGADVNAVIGNGDTALHYAAEDGFLAVADVLVAHGAAVNAHDVYGNTPLLLAVWNGHKDMVALLITNKADVNAQNKAGTTPLDLAKHGLEGPPDAAPMGWQGQFPRPTDPARRREIEKLLRQHGALDDLPKPDRITIRRPSASYSTTIFRKGTNDWNRFTLLETLLDFYVSGHGFPVQPSRSFPYHLDTGIHAMPFPDLSQVLVVRPTRGTTNVTRMKINLLNSTNGIDCSKDVALEFGDTVEIPERDHALGENIIGLTIEQANELRNYFSIKVQLKVRNKSVELHPDIFDSRIGLALESPDARNLLLSSSDISRVKVVRRDPKTGKAREWVLDCSPQKPQDQRTLPTIPLRPGVPVLDNSPTDSDPDLRLRDGDVIEVPEK